jgi:hypothetical protein
LADAFAFEAEIDEPVLRFDRFHAFVAFEYAFDPALLTESSG